MFILGILKTLLKPKLFERLHLHDSYESLHKLVPKELLPANVGGDLPDIQKITGILTCFLFSRFLYVLVDFCK